MMPPEVLEPETVESRSPATASGECVDRLLGDGVGPCCDSGGPTVSPAAYASAFDGLASRLQTLETRALSERRGAELLLRELLDLPAAEREELLQTDPRLASFSFAEVLLTASQDLSLADPRQSFELAQAALTVIDQLDPAEYTAGLVADLKARAWAYVGDAWRTSANREAAHQAFQEAEGFLQHGSGDPLEEAEILCLAAALMGDEGETDRAFDLLDRATTIFLEAGERLGLALALRRKGRLWMRNGQTDTALEFLQAALQLLAGVPPSATMSREQADLRVEIARCLCTAGRAEEAWAEVAHARSALLAIPEHALGSEDRRLALRLRWLEGRIAHALAATADAEGHLAAAQTGLMVEGAGDDAALAFLDRLLHAASLPAGEREHACRQLAPEVAQLLTTAGLSSLTSSALLFIHQALERHTLRPALVYELAQGIENGR